MNHYYQRMAELAKSIEGTMIISINDPPDIREVFADLPVKEVDYKYTVGGGDNASECVELIYGTWKGNEVPIGRETQQGRNKVI